VLVSRRAHGAHHRAPFEGNYCIVSGIWNPVLDQARFSLSTREACMAVTAAVVACMNQPSTPQGRDALPYRLKASHSAQERTASA